MIINRTRNVNGNAVVTPVAEIPVTGKAVHKATLMKEDFVKLTFESDVDYKFKAGDWVVIENGGIPYALADDYFPTMKDEATFSYELQFNAPWYNLDKMMFLFNTYNDDVIVKRESDWYITDTAQNILALIIRSTQDVDRDCPCVFNEVLDCEPTVAKTFTYSSTSILAALNNLAKEFELEWWVTYESGQYYLHFGECDNSVTRDLDGGVVFSDGVRVKDSSLAVELTAGDNVSKPSVSQKQGLKKKYYVFGSSRNIDQDVTQDMEAGFVTSIATKRLELNGNPQVMNDGSGEEVVVFDDIYPRSDYMITGVTPVEIVSEDVAGYDSQGNPVYKRYNVYNLKIDRFSDYIFSLIDNPNVDVQNVEDIVASGKPLSLKFISKEVDNTIRTPKLAGFEFELGAILMTDELTGNRWYEFQIIKQDINGYIVPNDNLIPEQGDWVCIFNVKGAYVDGSEYDPQQELLDAFNKWYANKKRDVSYTVTPYANEDIDLGIGDAVVLNYKDNSVTSRVFSFEKKLDIMLAGLGCSDASYTISSYAKFGSVNQLKEDVKVLTASIANGTAGGGNVDASTISNAVATYGKRLFLSKVNDDKADGHIEFNQGLTAKQDSHMQRTTFGTFNSGFLGSGACVDQYGAAEFKSIYSREYISTPEFRFNRITVTEGEQWNTNAFGVIERVDTQNRRIYLHLEDGDLPSVRHGDICRGIYSNIGYAQENDTEGYDLSNQPEYDDCNFPTKAQFFTSYFSVQGDPIQTSDGWCFNYRLREGSPHPCKNMKFAQYGNFVNAERQASLYQTSLRHAYIQQLEGVNTWEIHSANIASRYGYLGDLTVTLKNSDGTTYDKQLEGNGLYVQKNVYFGNATIQLDPVTIEDLKNQLKNYSVYLSAYTDVIKVDDAGNVIEGLWSDSGEAPNISRQYRIYTVVTAREGVTPLILAEPNTPAGRGTYTIHVQPYGCSCVVQNSTIFITGIDNVKDGVAGTDDDVDFDYDACRAMERVWVDIEVDCEGVGTIVKTMPITIKHDPVPYIIADLTNENASVSWSTEENGYVGLPVETFVNMAKGNENLPIISIMVNTINGEVPHWTNPRWSIEEQAYVFEDNNEGSPTFGWKILTNHFVGNEDFPLAGRVRVTKMPFSAPSVSEILFTCHANYAGVNYERTLSLHITRNADVAIWDIIPTHQSVTVDKNAYFNFPYVGVRLYCTDNNGRVEVDGLPDDYHLDYRISKVIPKYTPVSNPTGNPSEQGWFEFNSEGPSNLPYDAEIAFLESNGTQFIETGIIPNGTTGIKVKILQSGTADTYYAGLRNDSGNTRWCLGTSSRQYAGYGGVVSASQTLISGATENSLNYLNDRKFICTNGTDTNTGNLSTLSFTPAYNIRLFGSAGTTGNYTKWSGKIYWAKISQGSNVVMDLIPVRIGQVGYLYDKISGQLYGNKGSGVFVLGADVSVNETNDEGFAPTHDTSVQSGKTYYTAGAPYSTSVGEYINIPDISEEIRVNAPSYADAIKSIEFTLFNNVDEVLDSEEVPIIREGLGGQGSTGPSGNGVQLVTDYYMRAKAGYTPTNDLNATPSSSQVEVSQSYPSGWRANIFTPPSKEWPCVWHFTKYDYTTAPDYDTQPALLTTYSEDGNGVVGIDIFYLKTNEGNYYNLIRADEEGGDQVGWLNVFTMPDASQPYVWRYMKFTYSQAQPFYSDFELVAKYAEDGTSFQCAYKVFASNVTPTLDSVSTGANMPTTDSSSWSATTTGLVVAEGYALWMTQRTYKGANYGNWGSPVRISGEKGEAGKDGKDIEFIYKQTNDPSPTIADRPTHNNKGIDDYLPSEDPNATNTDLGWTRSPLGVTSEYRYEWMCQRIKAQGSNEWGDWIGPFVWSAYGDKGMDGDGVEYVFLLSEVQPSAPPSPSFSYTINGETKVKPWYGGVAKIGGSWRPEGWEDGEFVAWTGGSYNQQGEWIPVGSTTIDGTARTDIWTDDPLSVSNANPKAWVAIRKRINGEWGDFFTPSLWATYSETPNIHVVDGFWYNGDDPILDENGNPVQAEGKNGTGVELKGSRDFLTPQDSGYTSGKTTLYELTGMSVGDCYVVNSNRRLYFYNGVGSWPNNWTDLGEFKGADGVSEYVHLAWARAEDVTFTNGVITNITFVTVQQSGVQYDWMGICTTNSQNNPSHQDPTDWTRYQWNHLKGKDGTDYERVYVRTKKLSPKPTVNANGTYQGKTAQDDDYLPSVGNALACQSDGAYFTDDPVGVNDTYIYEWVSERKKEGGIWGWFSQASLWAKYSFDGQGVDNVVTKYLKTTMSEGVTYTTDENNWSTTFEAPDEDKPYVWRYSIWYVGDTEGGRSECELIAVYSPLPNINLLDDTSFASDVAMEAWNRKGHVQNDPYANPASEYYDSASFNNFFGVTTGTQGHNAYMGRFKGSNPTPSNSLVYLLEQRILDANVTKIEAGKWYTLSYWVKGSYNSMFSVACNAIDNTIGAKRYINGVEEVCSSSNQSGFKGKQWKYDASHNDYSTEWVQHTITFKTLDTLDPATNYYVQWTMYDRTTEHQIFICMPKLEVGKIATMYADGSTSTRAFPRTGEWVAGKQYYAGSIGESFIDIAYRGFTSGHPNWYRCIKSHISSAENSPTSANGSTYWKQASWDGFISTGLLLAQEAYIENLVAKLLRTGEPLTPHVEMHDDVVEFYGTLLTPSIKLCTDDDGVGVLRFYDKDGNALYDLGPNGITQSVEAEASRYLDTFRKKIENNTNVIELLNVVSVAGVDTIQPLQTIDCTRYYALVEGYRKVSSVKRYRIAELIDSNNATSPSTWNGREYAYKLGDSTLAGSNVNTFEHFIPDGWYASPTWGPVEELGIDDTQTYIEVKRFVKGVITSTLRVYFVKDEVINNSRALCYDGNGRSFQTIQALINANG